MHASRTARAAAAIAAAALSGAAPRSAAAHRGSLSYGAIQVGEREVRYRLELGQEDLYDPLGLSADEVPTREQAEAGAGAIAAMVARHVGVTNHGRPCQPRAEGVELVDKASGYAARVRLAFSCERRPERVRVRYQLFFEADPRHQSFTRVESGGTLRQHVFTAAARELDLSRPVGAWDNARDYLVLGVEHIFTGYDHVCFLLGLLLVAAVDGRSGRLRGLRRGALYTVGIVTAFTVAHSVTLILAALDVVSLPGRPVEAAIALSIAYVGAENLVAREPRGRWLVTFAFGLVHGLGFAGVLRDIGLPERGLVLSLVSFNLGVEIGQVAIVAAVFPLLHAAAAWETRRGARPWLRLAGSAAVAAFGALWLVERSLGVELFGGRLGT